MKASFLPSTILIALGLIALRFSDFNSPNGLLSVFFPLASVITLSVGLNNIAKDFIEALKR